jgi:hypothetical protein
MTGYVDAAWLAIRLLKNKFQGRMNFVGNSKAATNRVKQIVTVKTSATTHFVVSWLLIASGMTSSVVVELVPVKHRIYNPTAFTLCNAGAFNKKPQSNANKYSR